MKPKLKPFDLEAAKNGAKIQTRDGRHAYILTTVARHDIFPIVALVQRKDLRECPISYTITGNAYTDSAIIDDLDLVMAPAATTRYFNMYNDFRSAIPHRTRERADKQALANRVACVEFTYTEGEGL